MKLDEPLPRSLLELLRHRGYDASSVHEESLDGRADGEVAAAAAQEGRMLLTLDRGFGDVRKHPPGSHPGIIVLRPRSQGRDGVLDLMSDLLATTDLSDLMATVTVVESGRLRIRRPG